MKTGGKGVGNPQAKTDQPAAELKRTISEDKPGQTVINFEPNIQQIRHINTLLATGLFGSSAKQVVASLVNETLRYMVRTNSPLLQRDERP